MAQFPPFVLAGPILRRCDEDIVVVWIATSDPLADDAHLVVYDHSTRQPAELGCDTGGESIQVGARLHINLLTARPSNNRTFPTGKLLGYDIVTSGDEFLDTELLRYDGIDSPSFFIQERHKPVRIMQGSCRKPYGVGLDALAAADTLIAKNPRNLKVSESPRDAGDNGRPAVLFLTGDQIYADDVEEVLFGVVSDLARTLFGYSERIPTSQATFQNLEQLKYGKERKYFATMENVKFTTEDGEGHLLGLSEFAAMYLLVWSPDAWSEAASKSLPDKPWKPNKLVGQDSRKASERVRDMLISLPAVRRALANVPTYMIFDDHDVTDDWNIDQDFYKDVSESVSGRRVVANALAAYFLFQGWGNDPGRTGHLQWVIRDFCDLQLEKEGTVYPGSEISQKYQDRLWDFHDWMFTAPTDPLTVFIDVRTRRELFRRGTGPNLMDSKALDQMKKVAKDGGFVMNPPLVIVSSAPVFNLLVMEAGQNLQLSDAYQFFITAVPFVDLDYEQWRNSQTGQAAFLRFIIEEIGPEFVIFLSGEVHYGVLAAVDYYLDPPSEDVIAGKEVQLAFNRKGRFLQLTSSALKNENRKAGKLLVEPGITDSIVGVSDEGWTLLGVSRAAAAAVEAEEFPDYILDPVDIRWVERGKYVRDDSGEASAPIQGRSNLGVVTLRPFQDEVIHEFCLVIDRKQYAPPVQSYFAKLSPKRAGGLKLL